jgi:hypothetical protein
MNPLLLRKLWLVIVGYLRLINKGLAVGIHDVASVRLRVCGSAQNIAAKYSAKHSQKRCANTSVQQNIYLNIQYKIRKILHADYSNSIMTFVDHDSINSNGL